jgi:hypothetical protein
MYSHVVSVKDLKVVFASPVDASKTLTPASNVVFALSAATSNAPTPALATAVKATAKYAALPAARMAAAGMARSRILLIGTLVCFAFFETFLFRFRQSILFLVKKEVEARHDHGGSSPGPEKS